MSLKSIMLCERSQAQRLHVVWFCLYKVPEKTKQEWQKEAWENFLRDETILYLNHGGRYIGVYICQNSLNCAFKLVNFILCKLNINKADGKEK